MVYAWMCTCTCCNMHAHAHAHVHVHVSWYSTESAHDHRCIIGGRRIIGRTPLLSAFDAIVQLPSLSAGAEGPRAAMTLLVNRDLAAFEKDFILICDNARRFNKDESVIFKDSVTKGIETKEVPLEANISASQGSKKAAKKQHKKQHQK